MLTDFFVSLKRRNVRLCSQPFTIYFYWFIIFRLRLAWGIRWREPVENRLTNTRTEKNPRDWWINVISFVVRRKKRKKKTDRSHACSACCCCCCCCCRCCCWCCRCCCCCCCCCSVVTAAVFVFLLHFRLNWVMVHEAELPNRPFHSFRASKSVDRLTLCVD